MDRTNRALALALALAAAGAGLGMGRKPPAERASKGEMMTELSKLQASEVSPSRWSGSYSGEQEPGAVVVSDEGAWRSLWKRAFDKEAPAVDFSKYFAVAAFAGSRNTGGYSVEFLPPEAAGAAVVIAYRVVAPPKGAFVTMAFTQPFAIQLYHRTSQPVKTEERP